MSAPSRLASGATGTQQRPHRGIAACRIRILQTVFKSGGKASWADDAVYGVLNEQDACGNQSEKGNLVKKPTSYQFEYEQTMQAQTPATNGWRNGRNDRFSESRVPA
jgi:hypothetical protein